MHYRRSNDLTICNIRLNVRQLAVSSCLFGASIKWYILFEVMFWQHPSKSKMYIIFDTYFTSKRYQIDIFTSLFTKKFAHCVFCVLMEDWKQLENPLIGHWLSKLCLIHFVECYITIKKEIGRFTKCLEYASRYVEKHCHKG